MSWIQALVVINAGARAETRTTKHDLGQQDIPPAKWASVVERGISSVLWLYRGSGILLAAGMAVQSGLLSWLCVAAQLPTYHLVQIGAAPKVLAT